MVPLIFAGVNGYLDAVPVDKILAWEADFIAHLKTNEADIMATIDKEGAISKELEARLKEVIPADPKAADADLAPVRASVEQGMENDLVAEFTNALRDKYPVRIHRQRIDQFFASN
jgi:hypothetical protein